MKKENLRKGLKKAIVLGCLLTALFFLTSGAVSATEMDATQNDVCITCHATPVNAPIKGKQTQTWMDGLAWPDTNFNDIHNIKISRYHSFVCFNCHNKDYASWFNNGCGGCHAGYMHYEENVPNRTNYSSTNFSDNYASSRNDAAKYAITVPRTNTDCVYCHQQSKLTYPTPVIANHDIYKAHKINLPDSSCLECHSDELTKEHAGAGRKDGSGKAISCITCHSGATKAKIPNYQPYRLRVSEPKPGSVNQVVYHEEYLIPGKELLGARISILTDLKSIFTVQAFYEGQWIDVYSKEVTRKWVDINGDWNRRAISLVYAVSEDITFPKAASKIRVVSKTVAGEEFYASTINNNLFEVKLDNWVFTNPDPEITCSTCHTLGDHVAKHDTGFDTRCTSCHNANLQSEHLTKIVASDKSEICNKCHEGNTTKLKVADVKTTIAWGQKECQNCHSTGHSIGLSPALPLDIPLAANFTWSSPMPAELFAGEGWMPVDAVVYGGKVLLTNRVNDSSNTPSIVWSFYRDKLQELGWTLVSGGLPADESVDTFKATFTKGGKNAVIWFYDNENPTGGSQTSGHRIQMAYWVKPADPVVPPAEPPTGAQLPNIGIASNGSVTMANVPLKALPDVVGDLTIELWAKTNVKDGLAYRTTPLNDYNNLGLYLPWNNGSIYADYGNSWANRLSAKYDDHWLNNWAHWTYVKKGNEAKLYKDKLLVARGTISSTYSRLNHSLDLGLWFNGAFDDLRIWNVARSEQEIFDNMGHELTGTEPGLVGYWKFNENTGTVIKDSTPNGNNGIIKGAVWENASR